MCQDRWKDREDQFSYPFILSYFLLQEIHLDSGFPSGEHCIAPPSQNIFGKSIAHSYLSTTSLCTRKLTAVRGTLNHFFSDLVGSAREMHSLNL